jgi:5-methyltetrahydrofolate--homocysteine methyltransferase
MIIIGEKINGTRKEVAAAISKRDTQLIQRLAVEQVEAGAHYLDVNAGTRSESEAEDLQWLAQTVQTAVEVPLCLDSPNASTLQAAIGIVEQQPMVNSISGETGRFEKILPLVAEHRCPVIMLALDDNGIPKSVDDRMAIIDRLVGATREYGVDDGLLYIDPLIMAISTSDDAGPMSLEAMRRVRERYPDAHLTGGLSNISYGAPMRTIINQAFLVLALEAGMDSAIMDPCTPGIVPMLLAAEAVLGRDRFCHQYNQAFRAGKLGS